MTNLFLIRAETPGSMVFSVSCKLQRRIVLLCIDRNYICLIINFTSLLMKP
jgi:hypothetical protein